MTTEEARRDFVSTRCRCARPKSRYQSFCKRCYHRLPRAMKSALYQRFGQIGGSYEEAYARAIDYLVESSKEEIS